MRKERKKNKTKGAVQKLSHPILTGRGIESLHGQQTQCEKHGNPTRRHQICKNITII